jgi:hypothetical protein
MIKKAQRENMWNDELTLKHKGYSTEDVSDRFVIDYFSTYEDEKFLLAEELS